MKKYILAIDQGTTSSHTLLIDEDLQIHGKANVEFKQHFPKPSWVEHDLDEIWSSVLAAMQQTFQLSNVAPSQIAAIGITNQRETTCLWERGPEARPISKAIVWQDRRTADDCAKLKARGVEKSVHKKTGLVLDPYFSGTKLAWLLKNVSGANEKAKSGKLAFGTIDSYLLYRMSHGSAHATDVSNASRTLLMDLKTCQWDEDLLKLFRIPSSLLPEVLESGSPFGKTKGFWKIPDGTPITGIAGDQQAALFGQACFQKGSGKCTYGTGAFVLSNIGDKPVLSKNGLLTTVAWKFGDKTTYGLEGSAFIAGAAVQWLRDGLGLFPHSNEIEALARTVPDADGVLFVPALSGLGAPHWLPHATGLITGLTRRTTKAHVAYAALEGIAFQVAELVEAMAADSGKKTAQLKVDGGASTNDLLMQTQADFLGTKVTRSKVVETTALGAGLQAGLGIGFWSGLSDIEKKWKAAESFESKLSSAQRKKRRDQWDKAVKVMSAL